MFEKIILSFLLFAIVWAIAKLWPVSPKSYKLNAISIPNEVKSAVIRFKEIKFSSYNSGLVAIPDLILENDKVLFVGEVKSRSIARYYYSDVIQMSVAKTILEDKGNVVSSVGFLKVSTPSEAMWLKVNLIDRASVLALRQKYFNLKSGVEAGQKCNVRKICERCEYRDVC
jgi:CRISPR/Cas system-associated exonuclease Cas4 (RecB family)